jgi:hypothetical protein
MIAQLTKSRPQLLAVPALPDVGKKLLDGAKAVHGMLLGLAPLVGGRR